MTPTPEQLEDFKNFNCEYFGIEKSQWMMDDKDWERDWKFTTAYANHVLMKKSTIVDHMTRVVDQDRNIAILKLEDYESVISELRKLAALQERLKLKEKKINFLNNIGEALADKVKSMEAASERQDKQYVQMYENYQKLQQQLTASQERTNKLESFVSKITYHLGKLNPTNP